MNVTCTNLCGKPSLDSLTRPLGEEGNPLHSPDVSSTRLRGGPDTTLQVTSNPTDLAEVLDGGESHTRDVILQQRLQLGQTVRDPDK